ncbi:MAG TPA: tRNA lysidine(34) synthetase TilS [Candidatus Parabacteroides intestinigallinarum]|uniref:tRNA(Ile)-lysidine synthase n=1 Tax=Candidatus Parabacteroides intestinigallinarum TaxID=2838722 RepID=A0A9D1XQI4_9BACT|nr:tRNA lysidine(34) synthetase TilS [Candidatus Parabacteroides intestinigallinarum]
MWRTVRSYIERNRLLSDDDRRPVLVGLSGGADSVALLSVLVRLGYACVALHCDFHLRGEESERDAAFARTFAESLGVPFYQTDFDTVAYAREHHLSIEMAARALRYAWFEETRERLGAQAIAVAHHRDDSVETVVMNLIRGTGIRGLTGIRPRNGFVVRPLLCVSRADIVAWLENQGIRYVTDSTNLSDAYTRNFIRLNVLPLLERINPSVREAIARSAEHLSAVASVYAYEIARAREEVIVSEGCLSIEALCRFPAPEAILYELLKEYGFSRWVSAEVFDALRKESGKVFYSKTHRLLKDRAYLWIVPLEREAEKTSFLLDPSREIYREPVGLTFRELPITPDFQIEKNRRFAYFDADKLRFPLTLRKWREGDWFVPFGMKGRQKLSDYFSDHKFSRIEKEKAWLLCSGDAIIWLIGERADNRFRIDSGTKRVLAVNFLD